jgi:hypothetical protein
MNRSAVLALLLAPALAPLVAGCGGSSSGARASTVAPVTSGGPTFRTLDRGSWSSVTSATELRAITDGASYGVLWASHAGSTTRPPVDFAREQVGALFLGERPTDGYAIEVVSVAEVTTSYLVAYQRTSPVGAATPGRTRPFHFVAVDRADRPLTFVDVTPAPASRPLADVHGELVTVPALAGGRALAFLEDGATDALELADPAVFTSADLHEGFTLSLSGDARPNAGGRSGLAEAAQVTGFVVDDRALGGAIKQRRPGLVFEGNDAQSYIADGPLAAALLAHPVDRPVYVTGRIDPARPTSGGPTLIVTSWRPTTTIAWESVRPLLGDTTFTVDDLDGTGACRVRGFEVSPNGPPLEPRGSARRLPASVLTDLRARVAAAALRTQPASFQPPQLYPGNPSITLRLVDAQGEVAVTVMGGSSPPPEVSALLQALQSLVPTLPTFRGLDRGDTSQIAQAGAEAARDDSAWGSLLARHVGGRPFIHFVDFPREVGVGVFDGQRPTGGFELEVVDAARIGPNVHLQVKRTSPGPIAPTVLTAPYHLVAVDLGGGGDLYADGARVP